MHVSLQILVQQVWWPGTRIRDILATWAGDTRWSRAEKWSQVLVWNPPCWLEAAEAVTQTLWDGTVLTGDRTCGAV